MITRTFPLAHICIIRAFIFTVDLVLQIFLFKHSLSFFHTGPGFATKGLQSTVTVDIGHIQIQ